MSILSAIQASRYLGVTERTVRNWINQGALQVLSTDPVRFDSRHVDDVLRARQTDAHHDLARRGQSPVHLAVETRRILHPPHASTVLPDRKPEQQRLRMSLVSDRAKLLFGTAALTAAQVEDGSCCWCKAGEFAEFLGTWAPTAYGEAFAALFGQKPCEKCGPGLYAPLMASLQARVHPAGSGPSEAPVTPSAAERQAAREWAQRHPVAAVARPVQGDDGRGLVSLRLRQTRERLKAAKRRGDQRDAIRLQQTLRALTADAAIVDGRAVARPGMLRCGHALAADCGCPRVATTRVQR